MWKRKQKKPKKTVNTNSQSPSITYITKGTKVNADIHCENDIRIAGDIKGEVESKEKLILAGSGKIKGTVISLEAEISGTVEGDLRISDKLTLRPSAVVEGSIYTKKISIEDGAQLKGEFHVGPEIDVLKGEPKKPAKPESKSENDSEKDEARDDEEKNKEKEDPDKTSSHGKDASFKALSK